MLIDASTVAAGAAIDAVTVVTAIKTIVAAIAGAASVGVIVNRFGHRSIIAL